MYYLVKFQKSDFSSISLIGFRVFWLSFNKTNSVKSAAEIITVYLFSRLLLPAYDVTEVSEEKARATTDERSQALLDKFSEHEVEFIFL